MIQEALPEVSSHSAKDSNAKCGQDLVPDSPEGTPVTSRLIEFPGATRGVPAWRKQLSQRVREVQERKAREVPAPALAPDSADQPGAVPWS
jgi:hypothetical protein